MTAKAKKLTQAQKKLLEEMQRLADWFNKNQPDQDKRLSLTPLQYEQLVKIVEDKASGRVSRSGDEVWFGRFKVNVTNAVN